MNSIDGYMCAVRQDILYRWKRHTNLMYLTGQVPQHYITVSKIFKSWINFEWMHPNIN